jgi:metacaspase-1
MMAVGVSIHIGLDSVDPSAYEGWNGALDACEADAFAMEDLARTVGYRPRTLLTSAATASAVFAAIGHAASELQHGDICLISYAGHGGQFADLSSDEPDALDETWLLYDREVLDDEIHVALAGFRPGVRVVVLSDSCHSGTVVRRMYEAVIQGATPVRNAYARAGLGSPILARGAERGVRLRGAPAAVQQRVLNAHRPEYERIRSRTPHRDEISVRASVILISGCQDNQESAEENGQGVFTASLLKQWNRGTFNGDYRAFREAIGRELPPTQSPNYFTAGTPWPPFEGQRPFTIDPPSSASSSQLPDPGAANTSAAPLLQLIDAEADVVVIRFGRNRSPSRPVR